MLWDTADLLTRCKSLARRPPSDQAVTDVKWYEWLTEAQQWAYQDLFTSFPDFAYSAPFRLLTSDGGLTYNFGLDADGDLIRPWGHLELYPTLSAIPDSPLSPGADFLFEDGIIRFPGGRTRSFSGGAPYSRFVADPDIAIELGVDPLLQPKSARLLLVYKACERWAGRRGSGANPQTYRDLYKEYLQVMYKRFATAYNSQGSQAAGAGERVWWYSQDLGVAA